jgi:CBS domain-containing protein
MTPGHDLRVAEAMTAKPLTIDGMASVNDALAEMRVRNISCLVVQRRNDADEYGLLLIADIAREIANLNRPVARTQVYEVMQKPAPALDAEMRLRYAIRYMTRFGLSHCLVLRGRELAGVVSLRDITVRFLEAQSPPASGAPDATD